VGTGKTALPHLMRNCGSLVSAIDNITDYWEMGFRNRHYHVIDDDICNNKIKEKFDLVTCVSVLEHIVDHQTAVKSMFSLLSDNGYLLITCPYSDTSYIENVYALENSSYGKDAKYTTQSYSRAELDSWLAQSQGVVVDQEYWQFWEGDHWTVGKQVIPPKKVSVNELHQMTCLLLKKSSI
jgi:2-polyprenyl-3-methyl-5-hydroxy-6-metoxy-1,4-benzoquinol methylase